VIVSKSYNTDGGRKDYVQDSSDDKNVFRGKPFAVKLTIEVLLEFEPILFFKLYQIP